MERDLWQARRCGLPPSSIAMLLMARPSSALRAPSPRARGEGEQVTHWLPVTPRPAERGEGDTKRSGVRVRGASLRLHLRIAQFAQDELLHGQQFRNRLDQVRGLDGLGDVGVRAEGQAALTVL